MEESKEKTTIPRINIKIEVTDDPKELKDRAVELHGHIDMFTKYYDSAKYMLNVAESELSNLRDKSLIDADADSAYSKKSVDIKSAYGKSQLKYNVKILSPLQGDDFLTNIEGEYTYDSFKKVVALLQYKADRLESKLKELMKAIEICNYYPIKSL